MYVNDWVGSSFSWLFLRIVGITFFGFLAMWKAEGSGQDMYILHYFTVIEK